MANSPDPLPVSESYVDAPGAPWPILVVDDSKVERVPNRPNHYAPPGAASPRPNGGARADHGPYPRRPGPRLDRDAGQRDGAARKSPGAAPTVNAIAVSMHIAGTYARRTGTDRREWVGEAWLAVADGGFPGWRRLFGVLQDTARQESAVRTSKRRCGLPIEIPVSTPSHEARTLARVSVERLLCRLTEQERRVVRECELNDRKAQDVAAAMGLTPGRVSQIRHVALGKMRQPSHL